jgi:hypothetical protein
MIFSNLYSSSRLQLQPKVSYEEVKSARNDDDDEEEDEEEEEEEDDNG